MKRRLVLGVTGSVAAIKTRELVTALDAAGFEVRIAATKAALYFLDPLEWPAGMLVTDDQEWPGDRYQRGQPVLHIELRRWAEGFLVAPLDANTLAKFAQGLADNLLTCLWRAWDPRRPVWLAPAMNTLMWDHPLTRRHLLTLATDAGLTALPPQATRDTILAAFQPTPPSDARSTADRRPWVIIPPICKVLACGDEGLGAMAEVKTIVQTVQTGWPDAITEVKPTKPCA